MTSTQGYQIPPATTSSLRPMTELERKTIAAVTRPKKANAIGMSVMAMITAVMINFTYDAIVIVVPLFIGFLALGMGMQARKTTVAVNKVLAAGTVTELRATPVQKSVGRGWQFGVFSVARSGELGKMLSDGVPASFGIVPETKHLVSVNGVGLSKPLELIAPAGFQSALGAIAAPAPQGSGPQPAQATLEELPPPPED